MLNSVFKEIVNHKYKTKQLKKQSLIAKRTKKRRIKNKALTKLLFAYLEENPVKIIGEVVEFKGRKILELKRIEIDSKRLINNQSLNIAKKIMYYLEEDTK